MKSTKDNKASLLIFAKAPLPGQVKTRLSGKFGYHGAVSFYQSLLLSSLECFSKVRHCRLKLYCAPNCKHGLFRHLFRQYRLTLHRQIGKDLGQRMFKAARDTLKKDSMAILVGTDCPELSVSDIKLTIEYLAAGYDAVIAPSVDGGYVLLGIRKAEWQLFAGIPWGGNQVFQKTKSRIRTLGWECMELPLHRDIDIPLDLFLSRQLLRKEKTKQLTFELDSAAVN